MTESAAATEKARRWESQFDGSLPDSGTTASPSARSEEIAQAYLQKQGVLELLRETLGDDFLARAAQAEGAMTDEKISTAAYGDFSNGEQWHPGHRLGIATVLVEMGRNIHKRGGTRSGKGESLLCIGTGPGNDLGAFSKTFPEMKCVALEPELGNYLRACRAMSQRENVLVLPLTADQFHGFTQEIHRKIQGLRETDPGEAARLENLFPSKYSHSTWCFALDHCEDQEGALRTTQALTDGNVYLLQEVLPALTKVDPEGRKAAQHLVYHTTIIEADQRGVRRRQLFGHLLPWIKQISPRITGLEAQAALSGILAADPRGELKTYGCDFKKTYGELAAMVRDIFGPEALHSRVMFAGPQPFAVKLTPTTAEQLDGKRGGVVVAVIESKGHAGLV